MYTTDTIVAQATPPGFGSIGIVRISGCSAKEVAQEVLHKLPKPRYAHYLSFLDREGTTLDQGIALWFPAPNSFTGEDVLELQGHGGPVVIDLLLKTLIKLPGVRMARPGEFCERAFLNDKFDLSQAEAIADLIDARSEQAARSAIHSLQGAFSDQINKILELLTQFRIYVESSIDFPNEERDFLSYRNIGTHLNNVIVEIDRISTVARNGSILCEGMKVVISGPPNAGKSSIFNSLSGYEAAIVTNIAGTTRDILRENIYISGIPINIIDTAGLREAVDEVERIGIEHAWNEIEKSDYMLFVEDSTTTTIYPMDRFISFLSHLKIIQPTILVIRNKSDLTNEKIGINKVHDIIFLLISARTGKGMEVLYEQLKNILGFRSNTEGIFLARRRHLLALEKTLQHLEQGKNIFIKFSGFEFLAEELKLAQQSLSEITGTFTSHDLLSSIFSQFCLGK